MKRVVALTVAALGVLAIVGAIAVAHEAKYELKKLKITHPTAETFSGKVKSGGGCKVDRVVKVEEVDEYGGRRRRPRHGPDRREWALDADAHQARHGGRLQGGRQQDLRRARGVPAQVQEGDLGRYPGRLTRTTPP